MNDGLPAADAPPLVEVLDAVRLIGAGGVVAYPTEAVYGLGCDPADADAVERVLALKGRDAEKGLILVAADANQLAPWLAPLEPAWRSRMDAVWPGPVTFVVPAAPTVPERLSGGRPTLAVRVSDHPVVRALCVGCGHPLVSTSANRSGEPALRDAAAVARTFGVATGEATAPRLDAVVAGDLGGRERPSTIVDVRTGERLRA